MAIAEAVTPAGPDGGQGGKPTKTWADRIRELKDRIDAWLLRSLAVGAVAVGLFGLIAGTRSGAAAYGQILVHLLGGLLAIVVVAGALAVGVIAGFLFGLPGFKAAARDHTWLACAYGQRHLALRSTGADAAGIAAARARAVEQIAAAVNLDPAEGEFIGRLYDPSRIAGQENDLVSLYPDGEIDKLLAAAVRSRAKKD